MALVGGKRLGRGAARRGYSGFNALRQRVFCRRRGAGPKPPNRLDPYNDAIFDIGDEIDRNFGLLRGLCAVGFSTLNPDLASPRCLLRERARMKVAERRPGRPRVTALIAAPARFGKIIVLIFGGGAPLLCARGRRAEAAAKTAGICDGASAFMAAIISPFWPTGISPRALVQARDEARQFGGGVWDSDRIGAK